VIAWLATTSRMYNGHMKRYSVAEARARFSDLLDAAEQGQPAVIERRGVRFVIRPEESPRRGARQKMIESVDPDVAAGQWTWEWSADGLDFRGGRSPK
jgi:prevent-host-death family protein